jgi:Tol biopolymer transport system component
MFSLTGTKISWNPDVNTNPPYQYVYDNTADIRIAALFDGDLGDLQGANTPNFFEQMPSWGPNGKIAFARGTQQAQGGNGQGTWGIDGPVDLMIVDATGGTATPIPGASGNGMANYYPAFSRNSMWIAFTQSASAQSTIAATDAQIRLVRSDLSGTVLNLPRANGAASDGASSYPTWSVDGAFLSFSSNRSGGRGGWDIYIAPIDPVTGMEGAAMNIQQANTGAFEHSAQWSP